MSDFDKEAEREKLREKYEQEEEKRKTTEQMSELLLKGATMTNAHCGDCGDPIFRYDGQEFCPTCEKPVDRGTEEAATDADGEPADDAGERAGANGSTSAENIEVADPSDDASVRFGGGDAEASADAASGEQRHGEAPGQGSGESQVRDSGESPGRERPGSPERAGRSAEAGGSRNAEGGSDVRSVPSAAPSDSTSADRPMPSGDAAPAESRADGSVADHLDRAQVVLSKTIERHARQAAAADSPREARDHLETAREAAETLDATGY